MIFPPLSRTGRAAAQRTTIEICAREVGHAFGRYGCTLAALEPGAPERRRSCARVAHRRCAAREVPRRVRHGAAYRRSQWCPTRLRAQDRLQALEPSGVSCWLCALRETMT